MNQALLSNNLGTGDESDRVNELVENYLKKNTELYDIENLIPVCLSVCFFFSRRLEIKIFKICFACGLNVW